jgi:hypothetical protein
VAAYYVKFESQHRYSTDNNNNGSFAFNIGDKEKSRILNNLSKAEFLISSLGMKNKRKKGI